MASIAEEHSLFEIDHELDALFDDKNTSPLGPESPQDDPEYPVMGC